MGVKSLNESDRKILRILQEDASLTFKEVSEKAGISVVTYNDRLKRLKQKGFVKRLVLMLDRKMIERELLAFITVTLNSHAEDVALQFSEIILQYPEVMECFQLTASSEFLLRVSLQDMNEYTEFYTAKLIKLPMINSIHASFVLREIKSSTAYPV